MFLDFENAPAIDVFLTMAEYLAKNRDLEDLVFTIHDENNVPLKLSLRLERETELRRVDTS